MTDVKRAELAQRFLAEASAVLASGLDYEQTLAKIAELAVPRLADWCAVDDAREGDWLRSVAVAHADPAKVAFARAYQERYPTDATRRPARRRSCATASRSCIDPIDGRAARRRRSPTPSSARRCARSGCAG